MVKSTRTHTGTYRRLTLTLVFAGRVYHSLMRASCLSFSVQMCNIHYSPAQMLCVQLESDCACVPGSQSLGQDDVEREPVGTVSYSLDISIP
jgi:hypothetical protein